MDVSKGTDPENGRTSLELRSVMCEKALGGRMGEKEDRTYLCLFMQALLPVIQPTFTDIAKWAHF